MPTMTYWDESFSVGSTVLDKQHQQLLDLCNQLGQNLKDTTDVVQFEFHEILHRLAEYSRLHFETEEGILRNVGYPDLKQQIADHTEYCKVITHSTYIAAITKTVDRLQLQRFVAKWWTDHILIDDMKYREFLISNTTS